MKRTIELVNDINSIRQLMVHTPESSMLYAELDEYKNSIIAELLNRLRMLKEMEEHCNAEDTK